MTGTVDAYGRALLNITIHHPTTAARIQLDAWVDTGFSGSLLLTPLQISTLGLPRSAAVPGSLADGSQIVFDSHACLLEWFGCLRQLNALAGSSRFALIGVGLLEDHLLTIDYPKRVVTVVPSIE